ncbi:Uncharacterised protein [Salmonella enterica subsp. arizonae]|uniref:Uncharacterized protein n=1 Tax=Salmonella enterica subsp. arizonae TaxID=59203 RepID=A0A2X4T163_SALER|nr:Uncharacterised protein [Salmonella enterica subsp. arizonae]
MILFKPDQLIQRVETERADAGERLQLPGRDIASNRFHHGGGSRTFPTDDRIEQLALRIDQRAVNPERRHRNTAYNTPRQGAGERLAAVGEALQDGVQRPLMPGAIFCGNVAGVGG